jgi:hypothetical protein
MKRKLSRNIFKQYRIENPDLHGPAVLLVGWIGIRIWNADPDPGQK